MAWLNFWRFVRKKANIHEEREKSITISLMLSK